LAPALAGARPHRITNVSPEAAAARGALKAPPLRVVLQDKRAKWANCLFSTRELAERAPPGTPTRDSFDAGEPIWGRCYLADPLGANRAGELVDVITVDGKKAWEQAYDQALPSGALARLVPYGEVLRTLLSGLGAGAHRIEIEGTLRRGRRVTRLYAGEFRFVR
jgi:hypothetical protein